MPQTEEPVPPAARDDPYLEPDNGAYGAIDDDDDDGHDDYWCDCEDCALDRGDMFTCHECEEMCRSGDGVYISSSSATVCTSCYRASYTTCDQCDDGCHANEVVAVTGGGYVCPYCACYDYERCDVCAIHVPRNRTEPCHLPPCTCDCERCCHGEQRLGVHTTALRPQWPLPTATATATATTREVRDRGQIKSYSYRPRAKFHGEGPLYLGTEIELTADNPRASALRASELLGEIAYYKDDASISRGFELVTHPMSFQWARDEFPWKGWDELRPHIDVDSSTGMHVHVSRAAFRSPLHMYQWMMLLYRNEDGVSEIARRRNNRYCVFQPEDRAKFARITGAKRKCGYCWECRNGYGCCNREHMDRYSAINTLPEDTVEVRVFASTTQKRHILAALGLVDASVRYAAELDASKVVKGDGWSWNRFGLWVKDQGEYRDLVEVMGV